MSKMKPDLAKPFCCRWFLSQGNDVTRPNWPLIRKKAWYYRALLDCWGALGVDFLKLVIISYSGDRDFLCICVYVCFVKTEKRGGGSHMKWELQISTQPLMGSRRRRGRWSAVDFPSWDRDIITLGVETQKSPSSVPRLLSTNYKT